MEAAEQYQNERDSAHLEPPSYELQQVREAIASTRYAP
jgi:hypothetical protein